MQDKRAEIVEAMARVLADLMIRDNQRFNTKEYASAVLGIALKAAAEIADARMRLTARLAGESEENSRDRDRLNAKVLCAMYIKEDILALMKEKTDG